MRKNSARKWLHATLDLLPVVIIPIFALYATNKNATFAQEITVSQNKVVDFNQLIVNGDFVNTNDWNSQRCTISTNNNQCLVVLADNSSRVFQQSGVGLKVGHKYLGKITLNPETQGQIGFGTSSVSSGSLEQAFFNDTNTLSNQFSTREGLITANSNDKWFKIVFYSGFNENDEILIKNVQIFDLTQMFGVGNEPTIEQFNEWYQNDYYDYNLSQKQLLKDYDQITYNDTDIGSQFIYGLYNSVDKYFNIGNVFNLGFIYDWLLLNIFNGNSPIAIYIVWNIVAYEFLMDLLFLLYGLFMFFIDTCTNLMDRFYCTLSGRR